MKKTWLILLALMTFALAAQERKTALTVNDSGECSKAVNFTATVLLNNLSIATQAYSDGLVNAHNVNGSAHSDKLKASNNLSDLSSASTARTNLQLGSAAVLNAGTGANNVPQLDAAGKLLSSIFPASGVTSGTYGSSTLVPVIIVDSTGRITGISTVSVSGGSWGTITGTLSNQTDLQTALNARISAPDSPAAGDILYYSGSAWVKLVKGSDGQALILVSGLPAWTSASGLGDMLASVYDPASIGEQLVGLTATQTLTNKTLTGPVISTISNTGTLTLPTSTDTLVGRATTDTLTNKSIDADSNTITNIGSSEIKSEIITGLTEKSSPVSADKIMLSDSESSGALKYIQIGNLPGGSGGSGEWGDITGTLADQTDLVEYIAERALRDADVASNSTSSDHGKPLYRFASSDGIDSATKLCVHFNETDAAFTDSSSSARTLTNTSVTYNASGVFGGCGYFNGSAKLTAPYSADLNPGTGDFCFDARIKISSASSVYGLFGSSTTNGDMTVWVYNGYLAIGRHNVATDNTATTAVPLNEWVHVAITRSGSTLRMFQNGSLINTFTNSNSYAISSAVFTIGAQGSANFFTGYMDEFRWSVGDARWTSSFSVPAAAYSASTFDNRVSDSKAAQNIVSRTTTAPTIAAGAGAGTSPTVSVTGTDNSGQITITTGTSPIAAATIATITFASTYLNTPYVVISPANANAAALYNTTRVYAASSTTAITLTAGSAALTASTQYIWNYHAF